MRVLGPEFDLKTFLLTVLFSLGFDQLKSFKEKENFVLFPFSAGLTYDKFSVCKHTVQRAKQPVVHKEHINITRKFKFSLGKEFLFLNLLDDFLLAVE